MQTLERTHWFCCKGLGPLAPQSSTRRQPNACARSLPAQESQNLTEECKPLTFALVVFTINVVIVPRTSFKDV
ncbi:hypothetical protein BDN67DRAFT_970107 [Paxillus ammoniavirescens]|nr:hypothetical protein BDN67DRAFT_970107 [Paxillus ammoniavirescens]